MSQFARKILLPRLVITELAHAHDEGAIRVPLPDGSPDDAYYVRPKHNSAGERIDEKPRWVGPSFNLFPVVLGSNGAPWAEANIYLLSRLEGTLAPTMATFSSIADDLVAYRRFLDETGIDWTNFPKHKLKRPTYRYSKNLNMAVELGNLAATTAQRRMSTVVAFYRWLQNEGALVPEHPPWQESDRYIQLKDALGFKLTKRIATTDVSIRVAKQRDPYKETIDDGGKLRPLPPKEQGWLLYALKELGNTEMTLIHLFGLLTGARIQTILTFRVRHVLVELDDLGLVELPFPIGPGTGVDTKHNKQMVLHIPVWFYQMLRTYAHSERACKRRRRATGGDTEDQYLFLSIRGVPLYRSKHETQLFDPKNNLRHSKNGQGVRQFITDTIIPLIRSKYGAPTFHYRFHDTRASFGSNLTSFVLDRVTCGEMTLHEAREFVRIRMGHESYATTDLYLQHSKNLELVRDIGNKYEDYLKGLAESAMLGAQ